MTGHDRTVRDLRREPKVRSAVAAAGVEAGERLSVVVAELTGDDGWAAAVDGCRYVLHVASPFPATQPKDPDELIVPARDGALRVLRAALDGGVERVVLTSALAAIHSSRVSTPEAPYTEADWTDGADTSLTPYRRSPRPPRGSSRAAQGPTAGWRRSTRARLSAPSSARTARTPCRRSSGCCTACPPSRAWASRSSTYATSLTCTCAR